eukprot:g1148.t1
MNIAANDNTASGTNTKLAGIENLYASVYAFNLFTITDGAIRIIVILHANSLGFSPIEIAFMFSLYELAGVVTNLYGGLAASKYGLKATMFVSLVLQCFGLVALLLIQPLFGQHLHCEASSVTGSNGTNSTNSSLNISLNTAINVSNNNSIKTNTSDADSGNNSGDVCTIDSQTRFTIALYITLCQMISGVSKDFMKVSCKTIPKLVTKDGDKGRLFWIVAWVTGMKNSFKGFGSIWGAILVQYAGFNISIIVLLAILFLIFPVPMQYIDFSLGRGDRNHNKIFSWDILRKPYNVNILSFARFFLFGSRDVWYEIGAPIFLRNVLQWSELLVGIFFGGYVIIYGMIQTATTKLYKEKKKMNNEHITGQQHQQSTSVAMTMNAPTRKSVSFWALSNTLQLFIWSFILYPLFNLYTGDKTSLVLRWLLGGFTILGLLIFASMFAVNSAVHSYLIVLYAGKDKAAKDIGFYYMANAAGRLIGTLLSGVVYQYTVKQFGLSMCLWIASIFMLFAGIVGWFLKDHHHHENQEDALQAETATPPSACLDEEENPVLL